MTTAHSEASPARLGRLPAGADVRARSLVVRGLADGRIAGPISLHVTPGSLVLLTGATPAARWALAATLTGRLPLERMRYKGALDVGGMVSPPGIRSVSAWAQSWRFDGPDAATRRLAALEWAADTEAALVVLSPGLDDLDDAERLTLLRRARELADTGSTTIVTAGYEQVGPMVSALADATINLAH